MIPVEPKLPLPSITQPVARGSYWNDPEAVGSDEVEQKINQYQSRLVQKLRDVLVNQARDVNRKIASVYEDPAYWMEI